MNAFSSRFAAKHRSVRHLFVLCLLLVGTAFYALGQEATVVGTVTDPSGSVVPGVTVTLTNTDTTLSTTVTTNEAGQYIAPSLHIGHYKLTADAKGFKKAERTGVTLNIGDRDRVDFALQVGATSETVTVEADAIRVQSDTSEQSTLISQRQVTQLATNGRTLLSLAVLTPGASNTMPDFQVATPMGSNQSVSYNGQRMAHNLFVIDGGEGADRGGSGFIVMPSMDSIAEFRTLTSNYSAEYGLSSAGTISTVLKSGTKTFHGGGWEFNRSTPFTAFDKFNPPVNASGSKNKKPGLNLNIYGFNIGGPVEFRSSNPHTFFFYNMEWRKCPAGCNGGGGARTQTVPLSTIYTGALTGGPADLNPAIAQGGLLQGAATQIIVPTNASTALNARFTADGLTPGSPFTGNMIPNNLLDPNALALLKAGIFPKETAGDTVIYAPPAPTDVREELARVDHRFSDKFSVFGHWISEQVSQTDIPTRWSSDNLPTVGDTFGNPSYSAVVHTTYAISPTLLNEAAFNYDGNRINMLPQGLWQVSQAPGYNQVRLFGSVNNALPTINLQGKTGANFDVNWNPWLNTADDYQVRDDLSWSKGTHQLKFGGSWANFRKLQPLQVDSQGVYRFQGQFTNYDFADFLLGMADGNSGNGYSEAALKDSRHWNNVSWAAYVQDNWRATHRLTVNLGLRWDGIPHTAEINGQMSNFYPQFYSASTVTSAIAANQFFAPGSNFGVLCSGVGIPNAACAGAAPTLATGPNPALNGLLFYTNGLGVPGKNPGVGNGLVNNHWANFGPRIGFAYDLTGNGKTIARAGFGVMFERIQGNDMYQAQNNLFGGNPNIQNVSLSDPHVGVDSSNSVISATTLPVTVNTQTWMDSTNYRNPASYQYSAGIQQQIGPTTVLSLAYVGNQGRYQSEINNANVLPQADWTIATGSTYKSMLPFLGYNQILRIANDANSHYNSFQAELHTNLKRGLQLSAAYTLAHGLDPTTNTGDGGDLDQVTNPYLGWQFDQGNSPLDRQQVGFVNFVYDLPIFRTTDNRALKAVAGGWQLSGIVTLETGLPVNMGINATSLGGIVQGAAFRPSILGPVSYVRTNTTFSSNHNNTVQWFDPSNFFIQNDPGTGLATFGNVPHNFLRGPGRQEWNMALYKSFAFTESARLELRFETFNTFNHTQLNGVNATIGGGPDTGKINSDWGPRVFQLGAKIMF